MKVSSDKIESNTWQKQKGIRTQFQDSLSSVKEIYHGWLEDLLGDCVIGKMSRRDNWQFRTWLLIPKHCNFTTYFQVTRDFCAPQFSNVNLRCLLKTAWLFRECIEACNPNPIQWGLTTSVSFGSGVTCIACIWAQFRFSSLWSLRACLHKRFVCGS